jgi:hypothetical protein
MALAFIQRVETGDLGLGQFLATDYLFNGDQNIRRSLRTMEPIPSEDSEDLLTFLVPATHSLFAQRCVSAAARLARRRLHALVSRLSCCH